MKDAILRPTSIKDELVSSNKKAKDLDEAEDEEAEAEDKLESLQRNYS